MAQKMVCSFNQFIIQVNELMVGKCAELLSVMLRNTNLLFLSKFSPCFVSLSSRSRFLYVAVLKVPYV